MKRNPCDAPYVALMVLLLELRVPIVGAPMRIPYHVSFLSLLTFIFLPKQDSNCSRANVMNEKKQSEMKFTSGRCVIITEFVVLR